MARIHLGASKLKQRRRKRYVRVAVVLSALGFSVLGLIVGFFWLPGLRINVVEVSGTRMVPMSGIQATAESFLTGTYFFILPRNNIFLYPKQAMARELIKQYPGLLSVNIHVRDVHAVLVQVVERDAIALWCGESVVSTSDCFLLDQDGRAYSPAAIFSGGAYIRYFGALAGGTLPRQYISPDEFHSLSALIDTLEKNTGTVTRVVVDEHKDVRVTFANSFDLLFVLTDSGSDILQRFALALSAEPFTSHALSDFLYLDLRFGDKLYYKLKVQ